jgi:3-hydroxymyristoyl/3-hydroxydecanoyl-(acyl carrier protein) dehydratase
MIRFTVLPDHPALPGHFPGRPVVPGVLLLDAVMEAVRASGAGEPAGVFRAKFPAPVLPGEEVEITLAPRDGGRVGFTCRVAGRSVLVGEVACPTA